MKCIIVVYLFTNNQSILYILLMFASVMHKISAYIMINICLEVPLLQPYWGRRTFELWSRQSMF